MANPLAIATQGKGIFPMLTRAGAISSRYGLTASKMDKAFSQLAGVLQDFACQATLPITATTLMRNKAITKKYQVQGLELAVHGFTHVDYSNLSLEKQCDHFHRALQIFEGVGISPTGFRSPYLRWNVDTLRALGEFSFDYDSSQALSWDVTGGPESEAYLRVLQFYNAQLASQHPSLPRLEGPIVRIPYCLPDDEALVERLRLYDVRDMANVWLAMLDRIYEAGELFTLGLHPERVPLCKDALRAVLEKACSLSPPVWIARLDEIAAWYRSLGQATFEMQTRTNGSIQICIHAPPRATLLVRSVNVQASTKTWGHGYEQIFSNDLIFRSELLPWIGVPPDRPASLQSFLEHQGYLVEISTNPVAFSYYFQRKTFRPEDERPLLAKLETGNQPLLRLGRWPGGAQAALAVTGDVDAFTLWDYGLRIWNR